MLDIISAFIVRQIGKSVVLLVLGVMEGVWRARVSAVSPPVFGLMDLLRYWPKLYGKLEHTFSN